MVNFRNKRTKILIACGVLSFVSLAAFGYFSYAAMEEIETLEEETSGLTQKIARADAEIRQIHGLEERVLSLRDRLETYVAILPDDNEIHAFVDKLTEFETKAGVQVTKLDDTQARARRSGRGKKKASAFESITYKLKLEGSYLQLLSFINLFENEYDRFVRIPSFKITAFQDRNLDKDQDPTTVLRQHQIDMELETYVYNPKRQGVDRVEIPGEAGKLERLRAEGKLNHGTNELTLARYEYEEQSNRRDPLVDPRFALPINSRISEEERRAQLQTLDDLRRRLDELNVALGQEADTKNTVTRMHVAETNDKLISVLTKEVKSYAKDNYFTVPDYASEFKEQVQEPLGLIVKKRGTNPNDKSLRGRDVEDRILAMEQALRSKRYGRVVELWDEVSELRQRLNAPETLAPLFGRGETMRTEAQTFLDFASIDFAFGGVVTYKDHPENAVIIIDGRSFSPGELVAEGLSIKSITASKVVFDFRGHEVSKRHAVEAMR